jgi:D-glycero-D-manno-heptose 1,7-bisphosphate phosphatase
MSRHTHPALFLERYGVINIDHAYVYRPEDFYFIDGIFELVAAANRLGYRVVVVTN